MGIGFDRVVEVHAGECLPEAVDISADMMPAHEQGRVTCYRATPEYPNTSVGADLVGSLVGGPYAQAQFVYYRTKWQHYNHSTQRWGYNNIAGNFYTRGWNWGKTVSNGNSMEAQGVNGSMFIYWNRYINGARTYTETKREYYYLTGSWRVIYQYSWPGWGSHSENSFYQYWPSPSIQPSTTACVL